MTQLLPPSYRELAKKLATAIEAFNAGRYLAADGDEHHHIALDIAKLELDSVEKYWDLVYECLQIAQRNPVDCFRQPFPQKSTKHKRTRNLPMWAFVVYHNKLVKRPRVPRHVPSGCLDCGSSKCYQPLRAYKKVLFRGERVETCPEEDRPKIAVINGGSLLYGSIREWVATLSSRSLHGMIELPAIDPRSFLDLVSKETLKQPAAKRTARKTARSKK